MSNPLEEVSISTIYNMDPEEVARDPEAIQRIVSHYQEKIALWKTIKEKKRHKKKDDFDLSIFEKPTEAQVKPLKKGKGDV